MKTTGPSFLASTGGKGVLWTPLLYIVALSLTHSIPAHAGEFEEAIARGGIHVKARHYDKAVKEYEKALQAKPDDPRANLLLGLTYANVGDPDRAIQHTEASIRKEPSFAAYHNLGLVYANKGDYPKAIEAYQNALKLSPESYRVLYQLGLVYATDLKFDEAIRSYEKVLELNPQFTDAYLGLGSAYYWKGDVEKALAQASKLEEAKDRDKARALRGWIENTDAKKKKD